MPPIGRLRRPLLALLLCGCGTPDRAAEPVRLRFEVDPSSETSQVRLGPLSEARLESLDDPSTLAESALTVWVGDTQVGPGCRHPEGLQPILGRRTLQGDHLVFEPRFPLSPGVSFTACAATDSEPPHRLVFRSADRPEAAAPEVLEIWPPAGPVPANLLRFYITFSEPMRTSDISAHVSLLSESSIIDSPFVEIPDGLWDGEDRRLTLFVHPGRLKRGVGPRQRMGPPLEEGARVTLRIDAAVNSRSGGSLGRAIEHDYQVTAEDRDPPEPSRWRIEAPGSLTDPVRIVFDEPLDAAQLRRFARVTSPNGTAVEGVQRGSTDGRAWSFRPTDAWTADASYRVDARRDIEDLAGNRPGRPFDVDTHRIAAKTEVAPEAPSGGPAEEPIRLSFTAPAN